MKTILGNNKTAAAITALAVILSVAFGAGRGLGKLRTETYNIFFTGVDNDNISIENDMRARIDISYNLASVADKYLDGGGKKAVESLLSARDGLLDAETIPQKYRANLELTMAESDLYEIMKETEMSERDANYRESLHSSLVSRNNTIEYDIRIYVSKAEEFNNRLNAFPGLLARIFGLVKPLDVV